MARIFASPEGINRILRAVGSKFTPLHTYPLNRYPEYPYPTANSDRSIDLAALLDASVNNYHAAVDSRGHKELKAVIRNLEAVSKAARSLRKLLHEEKHLPTKLANGQLIIDIERLLETNVSKIADLKEWMEDPQYVGVARWKELKLQFLMRSPFEWLAGTYLANDFWGFYGDKPTLQRGTDGKIKKGPFIRFVHQVLVEFKITNSGVPFSDEAIARALTDARKGRFRAKPK
jgi:hypothetical protein